MTLQSKFWQWQLLMTIVEYPGEYSAVGNTLGNILEKDMGECLEGNALGDSLRNTWSELAIFE